MSKKCTEHLSYSNFEVTVTAEHPIFDDILPKFDRLVLGCINEFLHFLFGIAERVL